MRFARCCREETLFDEPGGGGGGYVKMEVVHSPTNTLIHTHHFCQLRAYDLVVAQTLAECAAVKANYDSYDCDNDNINVFNNNTNDNNTSTTATATNLCLRASS